jgi:ribonucleoside-diphosphate reductase alpha chain
MAQLSKELRKNLTSFLDEDLFGNDENENSALDGKPYPVKDPLDEKMVAPIEPPVGNVAVSEESAVMAPEKINLTENALVVLQKRYLKKDENAQVVETPEELFRRVARFIASADQIYNPMANLKNTEDAFYALMANLEFMPNSPTLMNAGRELQQLSACFVLPVEDSMDSIFDAVKNTALIHKSGGGTGFSFSRIRPKNDIVCSTKGIASGPISFMHVFDEATETVKQGGTRRGANMAILRVDHPDILDFIHAKEDNEKLNNFNISVAITETFWKALENNGEYDLINPHNKEKVKSLKAREVFDLITAHAWENGEPGVIFIDRINRDNPTPRLGEIESTNPCGEQPLLPFESCNLGSINLARMVKKNGENLEIDFEKLKITVRMAVHFLDNVIDMNKFPLPQIERMTKSTRKIGLGVMGFSDLLIRIGIPYNSNEAIELAMRIMKFINNEAKSMSQELASKRGAFPAFSKSIYAERDEKPLRNATLTTIAPTGTISIIAGCSSGVEPLFALSFIRNVLDDSKLPEIYPPFIERLKKDNLYTEAIAKRVAEKGSLDGIIEIPEKIKKIFVTAHEVSPEWHIRMQAAFQSCTDNAVSKTVNFPNSATQEDVAKVYRIAHDLGCKGVTIYRDGSRDKQVLNKGLGKRKKEETAAVQELKVRPRVLRGFTEKLNTGQGSLYVTMNTDGNNAPVEVFANIGKSGGDTAALAEAIGRLISISLQKGVAVEEVAETLIGITGSRPVWNEGILVKSVPDGIGQILMHEFGKKKHEEKLIKPESVLSTHEPLHIKLAVSGPECPECGHSLRTEGGCNICLNCGYSHCG